MSHHDDAFDRDEADADEMKNDGVIARQIVYVRPVNKDELPNAAAIASDGPFYAVHDADGRPLALFDNRAMAFSVARTNNMTPLSVH